MLKKILVAPSLLAADFSCLGSEIEKIEREADFLHLDVMDGHYVPNLSFGVAVISSVRKVSELFFDVHLMISDPGAYIGAFAKAGADGITFHLETVRSPEELISEIHSVGKKAGISIHPDTPIENVFPFLPLADIVLVMSVRPGFGGQAFMETAPARILAVRRELDRTGSKAILSVDGGIDAKTAPLAVHSGAEMLVAGSYVFGSPVPRDAIASLKSLVGTV